MSIGDVISNPIIISLPSILPHIHQFGDLLFMLLELVALLEFETVIDLELPVDLVHFFLIKVNFRSHRFVLVFQV
jgi:hypothetical protein